MKQIVVVDDSVVCLKIAEQTLKELYKVTLLISGSQLIKYLTKSTPNLIILDVDMPDISGFEVMRQLRDIPTIKDIPVIFLTANTDDKIEIEGFQLGAVDFIKKPFVSEIMLYRVNMHLQFQEYQRNMEQLVHEKTKTTEDLQDALVMAFAELTEKRDFLNQGHIRRTVDYMRIFTSCMINNGIYSLELSMSDVNDLLRSVPLHNIGNAGIAETSITDTIDDDTRITEINSEYMKKHTVLGYQALKQASKSVTDNNLLNNGIRMAYSHHERWDGTGFPQNLKGNEIPLCARLMSIIDTFDFLSAKQNNGDTLPLEQVRERIITASGTHFDPELVKVFELCFNELIECCEKWRNI